MAAAGGTGGQSGGGGGVARASDAAGRSRPRQRLRGGVCSAQLSAGPAPRSRVGTRRERDEKGAPERPLPFIKQPKFNLSPLLRLRSQLGGANLRMGRDRGFRSSLLPQTSSPPPRPSLHPRPRFRRSGSNPAAACGKRLRAWISLPIGRGESRPGFQLAVRAVRQKPHGPASPPPSCAF